MVLPQSLLAAPLWSDVPQADEKPAATSAPSSSIPQLNPHKNSRRVAVSYDQLKATLASASALPAGTLAKSPAAVQLELPMPYGGLKTFNVYESSVMEAGLAARYPQIKTYKVSAVDEPALSGTLDIGPKGFHAYVHSAAGEVFIDPVAGAAQQEYYSYYKRDYASTAPRQFSCGVTTDAAASPVAEFESQGLTTLARTSNTLITYRIAIAATGEYSQAVKNPGTTLPAQIKAEALAEIISAISRINQIYERDLAIRLLLVANNDLIVFTNPDTDPYTDPTDPSLLLAQNQTTIDTTLTSAAYDVGHLFGTDSGGLAGLGVACWTNYKARGESGLTDPTGDPFHIDIVAHEIGHQLGANHSFNGTTESCAHNRNAATAYEPGSGSTIMAYAGICGAENVANYSDATFHAGSIAEIIAFTRNGTGDSCAGSIATQQAPTANAGPDYTIPGGTAFALTGTATDPEANAMTYQWDQMDAGIATSKDTYGTDNGSNALFRSFPPVETPERTFPQMATLISILTDKAETLPTENRSLNFRFTARDGNGGVDEDDMQITVDGEAGPFKVLQPNSNLVLNSASLQTIQWNAACTEQLPVNCTSVDILYTSDNGTSFTTLLGNTPNDGMAVVNFQNATASNARIKIACSNNIFFDISDVDFALNNGNGNTLPTDVIGGSYDCGTAGGIVNTGDDIEPNNYPAQAQVVSLPITITGTVNDTLDPDDYFEFVASAAAYTMTLNNFGNYDLDLYLYDYTGKNIIASSEGVTTSETIARNVTPGQTYYLVVNGYNTSGKDSGYTLSVQPRAAFTSDGGGTLSLYGLFLLLIAPLLRHRRAR